MTDLARLLAEKKVLVCCGAGGVGKTTTSAALALAAAHHGRRVLVLTIDPSRRLAETLGVHRNAPAPVPVPGIGGLDAWMLDPKIVADEAVRRIARDEREAERFLSNRLYQQATSIVAGMHEYTAMKALHRFVREGRYDLVILDTPPSRHALDFLEAPGRVARFLDGRIFKLFLPGEGGMIRRAASTLIHKVLSAAFGEEFAGDLTVFFGSFAGIFASLNTDLDEMRRLLSSQDAAFVLVTSPAPAALTEAYYFQDRAGELGLPFRGFVLNRSHACDDEEMELPDSRLLSENPTLEERSALEKLTRLAHEERALAERDRILLSDLGARAGAGAFAVAFPWLPVEREGMGMLNEIARRALG